MKRALALSLSLACLLPSAPLHAQRPVTLSEATEAHGEKISRLYPALNCQVMASASTPREDFEGAVRRARRDGIPESLIHQLAALRALGRADVDALAAILPALQADLTTFKPETSVFPERVQAEALNKTIETSLRREAEKPGSMQASAQYAAAMGKARELRNDLVRLSSAGDQVAIEKELRAGVVIPVALWRAKVPANTRLALTAADPLGNPYSDLVVDQPPAVPRASYLQLKPYVPDAFWKPFAIPTR